MISEEIHLSTIFVIVTRLCISMYSITFFHFTTVCASLCWFVIDATYRRVVVTGKNLEKSKGG